MKKKNFSTILLIILIIIAIGSLIYASVNIYKWYQDSRKIKNLTEEIEEIVEPVEVPDNYEVVETETPPEDNPYWDYLKVNLLDVDLTELKKINPDTVGFLQVKGTNINYPFVQTTNNSYYLAHDYHKSYNEAGWVFLDYRNNIKKLGRNTIIYAHGRADRSMFGSLKDVLNKSWYNNLDNHIIRLSTESKNTLWQIFSVYHLKTTNDYIKVNFGNDTEYTNFLKMIQDRSVYKFNTSVLSTDKILTLSTCYNSSEKMVVHAKLIKFQDK